MSVNADNPLSRNRLQPAREPHIIPAGNIDKSTCRLLIAACPAGQFSLTPRDELQVEHHGCLECGACRLLCPNTAFRQWRYPLAGFGLTLRYG